MMLVKIRGQPTYLLTKNLQIRFWQRRLRHASNANIVESSKRNDGIDITIEDDLLTNDLSSDSGMNNKDECQDLGKTLIADNRHERHLLLIDIINHPNIGEIETLCDSLIESKYTKIVRHNKITLNTRKL